MIPLSSLQRFAARYLAVVNRDAWEHPVRAGWWTAYALLLTAPAVLFARRLSGVFERSPSFPVVLCVGLAAIVACAALRGSRQWCGIGPAGSGTDWLLCGLSSLACLLLLLTITVPDAPLAGLIAVWSCVAVVESRWWSHCVRTRWRDDAPARRTGIAPGPAVEAMPTPRTPFVGGNTEVFQPFDEIGPVDESLPNNVTQQWTRTRGADGREALYGSLRADFSDGERTRAVHIVFCPPLPALPELCVEQIGGPAAHVDVAQLAPYGARLEVKLDEPAAEGASVVLQFEAIPAN